MNGVGIHDGGLFIPPQMQKILDQPGFISIKAGSKILREMAQTQFSEFDPNKLSIFALACLCGNDDAVKEAVENGTAPDLNTTQTPFQLGFITLAVLGAQRLQVCSPAGKPMRHLDVIKYLLASRASPDVPDITGHTALHHACTPPASHAEITKLLLENGANVNAQNRYGEVPLFSPFHAADVPLVDLLMAHGADLDIPDGNGDSPRKTYLIFGAQVTAAVQRWERKRKGEDVALWEEKRCENCKKKGSGLKLCARCRTVRYCSTECQRSHWKAHKPQCTPFCAETTVTLKPNFGGITDTVSRADLARQASGLATPTTRPFRPGLTRNAEAENKNMVIKVQVPVDLLTNSPVSSALGSLFIYNKKRDFVCTVSRASNPSAYDAIVQTVRTRGVGGAKAYFAAELKNPDELVVKISQVLAEQPF